MKNDLKLVGNIKCKITDQSSLSLEELFFNNDLKEKLLKGLIDKKEYLSKLILGKIKSETVKHNIIANVGLNVIARLLANDTTYSGYINYAGLGTGTTTAVVGDTELETEFFRNAQFSASFLNEKALLTAFFDSGETEGTFKEFGNFIDGSASADSGILFSRINVNWTKNLIDTMTVSQEYTLTNA